MKSCVFDLVYFGLAQPGSLESSAVWLITRHATFQDTEFKLFADGRANFNKKWSNLTTLPIAFR
jgi:hypothetical protein